MAKNTVATGGRAKFIDSDTNVELELFRDNERYKDDVFVAVNGRAILIKRGKKVSVPKRYAKVLKQQQIQDLATARMMDSKQDEFFESSNKYR